MNLIEQLQNVYNSEINFTIASFWDGGFDIKIGDDLNGVKASGNCDSFEDTAKWIIENALRCYPDSDFAKSFNIKTKDDKDFETAVRPLIKWMAENQHPHTKIIITSTGAELLEGVKVAGEITEYLKD
jgi:hypothetical protein